MIPGRSSGSGPYILGIVVLAVLAAGLIWKVKTAPSTPESVSTVVVAAPPSAPPPEAPQLMAAPPPPPKLDEDDGGPPDASVKPSAPRVAGSGAAAPGPGPCGGPCQGSASGALSSALRSTAQTAQGCYNRALRTSEVSGSMTVSVQVGPNGSVCSASLANDSVHSNEVASCVLGRFRSKTFPPPSGGCVTVNIPISFTIKQ
jgi:TonB family protein